jgi:hypothetical protein
MDMPKKGETEKAFGKEKDIAALPHGKDDQLRISICSYEGKRFVNMRIWYRGGDHVMRPTTKGVTFPPKQIEDVIAALKGARERLMQSAHDRAQDGIPPEDAP